MKLELSGRAAVGPAQRQNGVRDIASLLFMLGGFYVIKANFVVTRFRLG